MTRFWAALAATFSLVCLLAGCNDYNNSVQYNTGATLTNLSPSGAPSGSPPANATQCQATNGTTYACFTLYVIASGSNAFLAPPVTTPVVQWNGVKMPTTYIDTTNLSAQIPYTYLAKPGAAAINVYQPQNQGTGYNGLSNALTFTIYGPPNPFPLLSSVSPASAAYCDSTSAKCASVPITVTGSNFLPVSQNGGSSVTFTGASTYQQETALTVTSISSTQMQATIPGTLFCASGTAQINVLNPPSAVCLLNCPNLGGGDTNNPPSGTPVTTQTFTITNSTPVNTCPAQVPNNNGAALRPAISRDGRFVAYSSSQSGTLQVLLRDTCLGAAKDCVPGTQVISAAADGTAGNADSQDVSLTLDGRYVAFSSAATNLIENSPAGPQIFLRDTCNGASAACQSRIQLVSTDRSGGLVGLISVAPSISASGRFVAFVAKTPSIAGATGSSIKQVFVRDTCLGETNCTPNTLRASAGLALLAEEPPAITSTGRYVAYTSSQGGNWQIVLSDTCFGARAACTPSANAVSISPEGVLGNAASHSPVITPDARYIAFSSAATNLTDNAPLGRQVYLRATCIGVSGNCKTSTILASTDEQGQLAGTEAILPSLSTTGRYVAFVAVTASSAGNNTTLPNSGLRQVFLRDTCVGASNCVPQSSRISLQPGYLLAESANPPGPALAALGKQLALSDGKTATLFTPTVAVDDSVLLAIPSQP